MNFDSDTSNFSEKLTSEEYEVEKGASYLKNKNLNLHKALYKFYNKCQEFISF